MTTTGMESPQSRTIQFYYKGFSVLLTSRDKEVSIVTLLEESMLDIDWAITHNIQPSWNKTTNEEVAEQHNQITPDPVRKVIHVDNSNEKPPIPVAEFEAVCQDCGAKKIRSKKGNMVCSKFCWTK